MVDDNATYLSGTSAELSTVSAELTSLTTEEPEPTWAQNELLRVVVKNSFLHFEDKTALIVEEKHRPRARSASFCSIAVSTEPKTVSSFSHRRCRSAATPSTPATFPQQGVITIVSNTSVQYSSATTVAPPDDPPILKNLMSPRLVMLGTIGSPTPSTRAESTDYLHVSDLILGEPMIPSNACYVNTEADDSTQLEVSTLEETTPNPDGAKKKRRRRRGAKKDGAAGVAEKSNNFGGIEYAHSRVPKTKNLMHEFSIGAVYAPKTTLMIRNIPNRYRQRQLVSELNANGLQGKYDFVYLPMDKSTTSNVGYAFVNFTEEETATRAMILFQGYRFRKYQSISKKIASVSVAYIQGLENNVKHYNQCAVNEAKFKEHRPLVKPQLRTVAV